MVKSLIALGVLFFQSAEVLTIDGSAQKLSTGRHTFLNVESSQPSSPQRSKPAFIRRQAQLSSDDAFAAAEETIQWDVSSSGHFIAARNKMIRRGGDAPAGDSLVQSPQGENATTTAAASTAAKVINPNLIQRTPLELVLMTDLDSPIKMGLAVTAFLFAIGSIVAAFFIFFSKSVGREQLQRREEAAVKIQKRVRGLHVRRMMNNERSAARAQQAGDMTAVLLDADDINSRFRKLRPQYAENTEHEDKSYSTMVHTLTFEELSQVLNSKLNAGDNYKCNTDPAGLSEEQAAMYLDVHGRNKITPPEREDIWIKLLKQIFGGLFNMLLWFCVFAQVVLIRMKVVEHPEDKRAVDEYVTPAILTVVIVGAAVLQWYTEMQAEAMMESVLQMQSTQDVRVVRRDSQGNRLDVALDPELLVPGDIIFLEAGHRVPADVRILHCTDGMEVDNSALTGESMPEARSAKAEGETIPIMEARNIAFCATTVLKGNATCMVHSTGDSTFLGKIASGLKGAQTHSTLEIQIEHFVHIVALVAIAVGLLSIGANMLSPVERSLSSILENSATALFAQVPEGLLPTVTISLMIASQQLSDRKVLVRKLDAVETLGCVNVICSDKTGTLTTGEMSAVVMIVPEGPTPAASRKLLAENFDMNPLERLQPRGDGADNLDDCARVAGQFDLTTTAAWNHQALCICGLLNNGAQVSGSSGSQASGEISAPGVREWTEKWKATGSPTEVAILRASLENLGGLAGAMQFRGEFGLVHEVPFNSENKWMLTIHSHPKSAGTSNQYMMILKGAPERVLNKCTLSDGERKEIDERLEDLMSQGLRVLCFATRSLSDAEMGGNPSFTESGGGGTGEGSNSSYPMEGFNFVGLVGIEDPPKRGVAAAVGAAQAAGIKVVMVTGDHPATAKAIASRINIVPPGGLFGDAKEFCAIPGTALEGKMPINGDFSDDDPPEVRQWWTKAVTHTRVFARVSPIHKQVIVQAYQHFGNNCIGDICAMTGDGVNDAPALKQADVGVAMGIRGTEVAKDAADIVLMDDNFASIVNGVEQGRLASDNLQKSIMYTLCSKVPQVAPTFAEILGIPMALNAVQVLLIDIGTDIWTAIAFALQPAEDALMQLAPRHPHFEKLVNWKVLVYSYCYIGQLQMVLCWLFFFFMEPGIMTLIRKDRAKYSGDDETIHTRGMTIYYWTLVLGQIGAAICTTTKHQRIFGPRGYGLPNMSLNLLILLEIAGGVFVIYQHHMNRIFVTHPLTVAQTCVPVLSIPIIIIVDEIRKAVVRASMPPPLMPQVLTSEEVASAHHRRSLVAQLPSASSEQAGGAMPKAKSRYRQSIA